MAWNRWQAGWRAPSSFPIIRGSRSRRLSCCSARALRWTPCGRSGAAIRAVEPRRTKPKGKIISGQTRVLPDRTRATDAQLALVRRSLDDDKAEDIVVIDLKGKSSFADYMVIATGRSNRQVVAIAEHLAERLKQAGQGYIPVEGKQRGDWVLVDAGDVVVHVFRPEPRAFYALEKMWALENEVAAKPKATRRKRS